MIALEKTLERQVTVTTDFLDRDVIGISGSSDFRMVTVMTIRRGFLQGVRHFELCMRRPRRVNWWRSSWRSITSRPTPSPWR
jgi:excinuclease UvrABC nuclease subunit